MAPKRKRIEDTGADGAGTPRATRTSSRLQSSATASNEVALAHGSQAKKAATKGKADGGVAVEPATKKTRRATTTVAAAKQAKGRGRAGHSETSPNEMASMSGSNGSAPPPSKQVDARASTKPEPYSETRARELFKTYEDSDTPGEIGPEGFEKLCSDLDVSLEGVLPLVLAWQMHATEMAKFKESEWMQGTAELRASSSQTLSLVLHDLEDLLFLDKPPIQPHGGNAAGKKRGNAPLAAGEPYNRAKYYQYAADKNKAFKELYAFCFALAKPPTARNIDMDTASAFWSVLVAPQYPIMSDILKFIGEKGTYKGVNKDLWNMVLEFASTVSPDLSNFEADGAWPSMLDDFVAWKQPEGNVNAA